MYVIKYCSSRSVMIIIFENGCTLNYEKYIFTRVENVLIILQNRSKQLFKNIQKFCLGNNLLVIVKRILYNI